MTLYIIAYILQLQVYHTCNIKYCLLTVLFHIDVFYYQRNTYIYIYVNTCKGLKYTAKDAS